MIVRALKSIIEFLFPSACPVCGAPVSIQGELCRGCWGCFDWIDYAKCAKCGYPFASDLETDSELLCPVCASNNCELDWVRSACVYDSASRDVMLPFKHCGQIKYANFMSRAMIWAMRDVTVDCDIVMPVPLANQRLAHRTYNQAMLLARPIARAVGCPIDVDSVRRKYRPDMGHMTARQRQQNIHGAFTVAHPERIRGRKILLVDDVFTTGATFSELRRVLIDAGAAAVYGVTFCRVRRTI